MKSLLALLLLAAPLNAQGTIDPKTAEFCLKAADFAGCVQSMSGNSSPAVAKSCDGIRKGLAIVKERIISGISLTKLDVNTNPLSDALAVAKAGGDAKKSCSKLLADSQAVLDMIRILRSQWRVEIEDGDKSERQRRKIWPARLVEPNIKEFNLLAGGSGIAITGPGEIRGLSNRNYQGFDYELREWKGGLLGCLNECGNYVIFSVKGRMVEVISSKIDSALNGTNPDWSQR